MFLKKEITWKKLANPLNPTHKLLICSTKSKSSSNDVT